MTHPTDSLPPAAPRDDWSDDRLDAAFRARFDLQPPTGLADRIAAGLTDRRSGPVRVAAWRWPVAPRLASPLAALGVLTLLVASVSVLAQVVSRAPATGTAGPAASLPVGVRPGSFPAQVHANSGGWQPVVSVPEAIAIRDTDPSAREIAVGGWFELNLASCPFGGPSPLEDCAVRYFTWLMASPEQLRRGNSIAQPSVPAINPVLAFVDWSPPTGAPVPVVFAGHFHDPRAADCRAGEERTACDSLFIVDSVAWTSSQQRLAEAPRSAFGLEVVTVERAIDIQRGGSDEELAVRGWYEERQGYFSCPAWSPTVPLLQPICGGSWWLMAQPESLADVSSETVLWHGPTGPAVSAVFATASPPPPNPLPSSGASSPVPVVLVGHFNDRRAALCPADAQAECRSRFVVDAVAWVNGVEGGAETVDRREARDPHPSPFLVPEVDAPSHFSGDARLLGMVILPGSRILDLEPALAHGDLRVSGQPTLWVVTVLMQAGEVTYPGATPVAAPARVATLVYTADCSVFEDDGAGFRALPLRCPADLQSPGAS